ncbi:ribonuclease H family protein [Cytobacillus sp. S13-E01]|uniref:ribonuclease H family protein n=1 Tax=Cytobacillus sp. S13-E01 TaxID=3031326 RepID=UPI0023D83964|nr:ribonuclease H family protein [Cytobacillus sp. S13-E01]MDF0727908.1 ribonuclease H family protein [Cytobacillus sp. S13-E01]
MKLWVEWTYKTPRNKVVVLNTELMPAEEALLLTDDFEKTGRVKELFFYDEQHTKWTKKEITKLLKEVDTEPHDIVAYFDGGFELANHKAGLGAVIYYTQNKKQFRVRVNEAFDELETNNEAEYAAFWFLLQKLEEIGVHHLPVTFRGDSHVVLKQLSGEWPCLEEKLNRWLDRIEEKLGKLDIRPIYDPILRKENIEADKLATKALQGVFVSSNFEING